MISLSRRITIGTVALTMAVVGLAVVLVLVVARWQSLRVLDAELMDHAGRMPFHMDPPPDLDFIMDQDGGRPRPDHLPPAFREGGRIFLQVLAADGGSEVFRSPSLTAAMGSLATALRDTPDDQPTWIAIEGHVMRAMRVTRRPPPPGRDSEGREPPLRRQDGAAANRIGHIAIDAGPVLDEAARLAWTLVAVWVTASSLAFLAAWWLRRSVIGPIRHLNAGIRAIDPERIAGRVPHDVPQEMIETTRLLNDLLDRLAAVLAREKATIANIAHELRSPISGLRTTLEVAALGSSAADGALAVRCLPTVVAMHAMVANLLALARLEAGQERVAWRPVVVDELVDAAWTGIQPLAADRGVQLELDGTAPPVRSCPDKLRLVVGNLLDNAATYAVANHPIACHLSSDARQATVSIVNRFDGPAPDPARVFEPFWRGDSARTSHQHCGLGLALAKRIAVLLEADLSITVADGMFTAHLVLPLVEDAVSAPS